MLSSLAGTTLIGFDSAWAGRVPGAICALAVQASGAARFDEPRLVSFEAAADFIDERHTAERRTLVAIDQPTIVKNTTGMRPARRSSRPSRAGVVAASSLPTAKAKANVRCSATLPRSGAS